MYGMKISEDTKCGFFSTPLLWNMPGHHDRQGNSNLKSAKDAAVVKVRKTRKDNGATSSDMQSRM
jgi:hypothetical protein